MAHFGIPCVVILLQLWLPPLHLRNNLRASDTDILCGWNSCTQSPKTPVYFFFLSISWFQKATLRHSKACLQWSFFISARTGNYTTNKYIKTEVVVYTTAFQLFLHISQLVLMYFQYFWQIELVYRFSRTKFRQSPRWVWCCKKIAAQPCHPQTSLKDHKHHEPRTAAGENLRFQSCTYTWVKHHQSSYVWRFLRLTMHPGCAPSIKRRLLGRSFSWERRTPILAPYTWTCSASSTGEACSSWKRAEERAMRTMPEKVSSILCRARDRMPRAAAQ